MCWSKQGGIFTLCNGREIPRKTVEGISFHTEDFLSLGPWECTLRPYNCRCQLLPTLAATCQTWSFTVNKTAQIVLTLSNVRKKQNSTTMSGAILLVLKGHWPFKREMKGGIVTKVICFAFCFWHSNVTGTIWNAKIDIICDMSWVMSASLNAQSHIHQKTILSVALCGSKHCEVEGGLQASLLC